jgi:hypothetical protein
MGGISKFCFWADFGSFGQILLHRQWLKSLQHAQTSAEILKLS